MSNKPYFSDKVLIYWPDYEQQFVEPFLIKINELKNRNVDLALCIGTKHSDYGGKTWSNLYSGGLKRLKMNIKKLEINPDYYLSPEKKYYFSFYKHETKYFIAEGNHRTIIGRHYLNSQKKEEIIQNVSVIEYITDQDFFTVYQEITRDKKLDIRVLRKNISINRALEGEVMLLISSLNNKYNILFTKSYAKSLLSSITVYDKDLNTAKLKNEFQEQLISKLIIKILKSPYIFNKLFFSFFENKRDRLQGWFSSYVWQMWPQYKGIERVYYAEDIQNSKIIKTFSKLVSFYLRYFKPGKMI